MIDTEKELRTATDLHVPVSADILAAIRDNIYQFRREDFVNLRLEVFSSSKRISDSDSVAVWNALKISGEDTGEFLQSEIQIMKQNAIRIVGDVDTFGIDGEVQLTGTTELASKEPQLFEATDLQLTAKRIQFVDTVGKELATMTFNVLAPNVD